MSNDNTEATQVTSPVFLRPHDTAKRLTRAGHSRTEKDLAQSIRERPVSGVRKSWKHFEFYAKTTEPNDEEMRGILDWFLSQPRMSKDFISVITGIPAQHLREFVGGRGHLTLLEKRMLWMHWMLAHKPQLLMDAWHLATWGRKEGRDMPPLRDKAEKMKEIVEYARPRNVHWKGRLSAGDLARRFQESASLIRYHCAKAGVKLRRGRGTYQNKRKLPPYLRSDRRYLFLDWTLSPGDLAAKTGLGVTSLQDARSFYRKLDRRKLAGYFFSVGRGNAEELVEAIHKSRRKRGWLTRLIDRGWREMGGKP